MAAPVAFLAWAGWAHRWVADDAFIHFRVVAQLLAGHGPVMNAGERVEASTSPAWVVLLTLGSWLPIARETLAVLLGLGLSLWALVAAQWGALALAAPRRLSRIALPVGALVIAALPPFWDFATSGMETGLEFAWLATVFLGLARFVRDRADGKVLRAPAWLPTAAGLGVLIHPDLGLFCLGFVGAVIWLERKAGRWTLVRAILLAAIIPVAYQVFRMGYYAAIVPNTALAKDATGSYWGQGWRYLVDFVAPYQLWLPAAVGLGLTVGLIVRLSRGGRGDSRAVVVVLLATSLLYIVYVVHLGGDFMHARLLLPAAFAILLPVAAIEVSPGGLLAGLAVLSWAVLCALSFRTPYQAVDRIVGGQIGIANEANFYRIASQNPNPVTVADYSRPCKGSNWVPALIPKCSLPIVTRGRVVAQLATSRARVLDGLGTSSLPLAADARPPVVAVQGTFLGLISYTAGSMAYIDDDLGLADPLASRLVLSHRGRPGHERQLPMSWIAARFAAPASWGSQRTTPVIDIEDAHAALQCGRLDQLLTAVSAPLTPRRFVSNFVRSFELTRLHLPPQPGVARRTFCR